MNSIMHEETTARDSVPWLQPTQLLNPACACVQNDTYERVKEQKDERLLLERARITLDMHSMWRSPPGLLLCCRCASRCAHRRYQHADTESRYLHVFKREALDGTVDKVARHQDREDETRAASAIEFRRQHSTLLANVRAFNGTHTHDRLIRVPLSCAPHAWLSVTAIG